MLQRLINALPGFLSLLASAYLGGNLSVLAAHLLQTGIASDVPTALGGTAAGITIGGLALRYYHESSTRWDKQQETDKTERAAMLARAEKREDRALAIVESNTKVIQSLLERLDPPESYEGADRRRQPR